MAAIVGNPPAPRTSVSDDPSPLRRLRRSLHDGLNGVIARGLREAAREVDDGDVRRRHAERHCTSGRQAYMKHLPCSQIGLRGETHCP